MVSDIIIPIFISEQDEPEGMKPVGNGVFFGFAITLHNIPEGLAAGLPSVL